MKEKDESTATQPASGATSCSTPPVEWEDAAAEEIFRDYGDYALHRAGMSKDAIESIAEVIRKHKASNGGINRAARDTQV